MRLFVVIHLFSVLVFYMFAQITVVALQVTNHDTNQPRSFVRDCTWLLLASVLCSRWVFVVFLLVRWHGAYYITTAAVPHFGRRACKTIDHL